MRAVVFVLAALAVAFGSAGPLAAQQGHAPVPLKSRPGAEIHSVDLMAQAGTQPVNVEVVTACVQGAATFKIINKGEAWPRMGTLNIVRVTEGGMEPMAQRKMRFAAGQGASFRFKHAEGDRIGLFVQPSWYERPFAFDAEVRCEK
jgi:hypothetical protein